MYGAAPTNIDGSRSKVKLCNEPTPSLNLTAPATVVASLPLLTRLGCFVFFIACQRPVHNALKIKLHLAHVNIVVNYMFGHLVLFAHSAHCVNFLLFSPIHFCLQYCHLPRSPTYVLLRGNCLFEGCLRCLANVHIHKLYVSAPSLLKCVRELLFI